MRFNEKGLYSGSTITSNMDMNVLNRMREVGAMWLIVAVNGVSVSINIVEGMIIRLICQALGVM